MTSSSRRLDINELGCSFEKIHFVEVFSPPLGRRSSHQIPGVAVKSGALDIDEGLLAVVLWEGCKTGRGYSERSSCLMVTLA